MKTLPTIYDVFHAWAHQAYSSAKCSSVSFRDTKLFSYNACIAKLLPNNVVAHTTRTWSQTTTSHQSSARSATCHRNRVYCYDPLDSARENMLVAREKIAIILGSIQEPKMTKAWHEAIRSVKQREQKRANALHLAVQANEYLAATGEQDVLPIDTTNLDDIREEMERQQEADRKAREEHQKGRAEEQKEDLVKWRNYEPNIRLSLNALPPALRLSKDGQEIETSHGARIPREGVERVWKFILLCMSKADEFVVKADSKLMIGHFQLNKIRADGSIVVGCHDIAFSEIEGIAKKLELV